MRNCIKIFALIFFNISLSQGLVGAWERYENTESGKQKQGVFSERKCLKETAKKRFPGPPRSRRKIKISVLIC